jgi:C-terminal peptidase prc
MNRRILLLILGGLTAASLACSAGGLLLQAEPTATEALPALLLTAETSSPPSELPATIPPSESPTLPPPPTETATPSQVPTATGPRPSPSPLHLQVFEEIWNTINDNYLYRDFNDLDWNAVREETQQRIAAGMTDEEFYGMLYELIRSLGDEHSIFFDPERARQLDAEFAGEFQYVGIGVIHTPIPERGALSIVLVFPGSPAEQAGLQPHDNILAVDGQPVFDEQGNRRNILRGPEGSTITLDVQTPGQEARQVSVTRASVLTEMPVSHQIITTPAGKRIGYMLIPTFNEEQIDERVAQAIQELAQDAPLDGLILDNRHNGGGTSEVMLNTLAYFTNGDVGYFVQRDTQETVRVNGADISGSQSVPLVVLVGDGSASFGEVFAGILKDLGRATIIGQQTDGNVELLQVYDFVDGSRAWIAAATFRPLNNPDQNWEATGIIPDTLVPGRWDEFTFQNDPAIQAALQFLGG